MTSLKSTEAAAVSDYIYRNKDTLCMLLTKTDKPWDKVSAFDAVTELAWHFTELSLKKDTPNE